MAGTSTASPEPLLPVQTSSVCAKHKKKICGCLTLLIVALGGVVGFKLYRIQHPWNGGDVEYKAFHMCSRSKIPKCQVLASVSGKTITKDGKSFNFHRNEYGSETTGKRMCQQYTVHEKGNTFVYHAGHCQVQNCSHRALQDDTSSINAASAHGTETWSQHCSQQGQNLVGVHLFEWPWKSIAQECEDYLGPAGFNFVQVSPVFEHVAGNPWYTRYQPVSFHLESRSGTKADFIQMVKRCRQAGVEIMVDVVMNHMAAATMVNPKAERGKACSQKKNTSQDTTLPCLGFAGTPYSYKNFSNNRPGVDLFTKSDFHSLTVNETENCPLSQNRFLCDMSGLPDLNTESLHVQAMLEGMLQQLHDIGVTMLRVDAAAHVYPKSLAEMLLPFPWMFVIQEYYTDNFRYEADTRNKAFTIGSVTDMDWGSSIAQIMFDSWDEGKNKWVNRAKYFGGLLQLHQGSPVIPEGKAVFFLDNHDGQRAAKPWRSAFPKWDGTDIEKAKPTYKIGLMYNLLQWFELLWPYGDSVRIMSSFAFHDKDEGIPGLVSDRGLDKVSFPVECRDPPTTSPVTEEWDAGSGWICEHRWEAVAAMVRLRKLLGVPRPKVNSEVDEEDGHIAFGLGEIAFVAMSRGSNTISGFGDEDDWDLAGVNTPIKQAGTYCNLAQWKSVLPIPSEWNHICEGETAELDDSGKVVRATVPNGRALVIHVKYQLL